jgi:NADPH:quinone reductase-like Zn-dependent oxidoreductase
MADNVGYTPGTGAIIAADDVGGTLYQRVKIAVGADGQAVDVSSSNPISVLAEPTDNLLAMLSRIVKLLESNAVVDQQQRQRVSVDSFIATIPALTNVIGVGTVTTITSVTNIAANAGMDREQFINIAKQTYAQSIRSRLEFV